MWCFFRTCARWHKVRDGVVNLDLIQRADIMTTRILIVDDLPDNLDILRQVLEKVGYNVMLARSGEVALTITKRAKPDLILLDVLMPGMSGYEVCKQLKADEETANIPVIFITGNDDTQARVKGIQLGAVDFIGKPFSIREVITRVQMHLTLDQLAQQNATQDEQAHAMS
jgi:DNA-binding response OmpR family regulator